MMEEPNEGNLTGFMKPPAAFIPAHFLLAASHQPQTFTNSKSQKNKIKGCRLTPAGRAGPPGRESNWPTARLQDG